MILPHQTTLTSLTGTDSRRLKELWIESNEELLAVAAACEANLAELLPPEILNRIRQATLAGLPAERSARFSRAHPGGRLGCRVAPHILEQFALTGRVGAARATHPLGFAESPLPGSVRLHQHFHPVRDQGERGTCVAFATAALLEYLTPGNPQFSEQFLYWGCKELDGHDGPGTYIHTAMNALAEYGCCLRAFWPYDPKARPDDEDHGPPTPEMVQQAKGHRLPHCRTIEPGLVLQYRRTLAGVDASKGMPVIVGLLVFQSWNGSPEAHRTGKITLPLPGEKPLGGHAMCLVGYQDDPGAPGGGYFIARNSWGPEWALDSPEAAGHALVPYAYVEQFAVEAFTGPAAGRKNLGLPPGSNYVRVLTHDGRDLDLRLLKQGTPVVHHPLAPDEFFEDDQAGGNRQKFTNQGFAWTLKTKARVWMPNPDSYSPGLWHRFEAIRGIKKHFLAALDVNIMAAKGARVPVLRLPTSFKVLPWKPEPVVRSVTRTNPSDLPEHWAKDASGLPAGLAFTAEVKALISELNEIRVYELRGVSTGVHVVVAFGAMLRFRPDNEPELIPADHSLIKRLIASYEKWQTAAGGKEPTFTYFALGVPAPALAELRGWMDSTHSVVVIEMETPTKWATRPPSGKISSPPMRDFLNRLRPETSAHCLERIRACIDDRLLTFNGNLTEKLVSEETHYDQGVIRRAFIDLQREHPALYRVFRHGKLLAIRETKLGDHIMIKTAAVPGAWWRRHSVHILSAGISVSVAAASYVYQEWLGVRGINGILFTIPILYLGSCLQAELNRRAERQAED